ncbi:MAG: hypothetical protein WCE51_11930 [Chthoniobacterales bacterium]|jgi:hypothetical protein
MVRRPPDSGADTLIFLPPRWLLYQTREDIEMWMDLIDLDTFGGKP